MGLMTLRVLVFLGVIVRPAVGSCLPIFFLLDKYKSLRWGSSGGHLSEVIISDNVIDFQQLNSVCDIEFVKYFNFSGSSIHHLKQPDFSNMFMRDVDDSHSIQPTIDLSYTKLDKIDHGSFKAMRGRLKNLYLQRNNFHEFPTELCQLTDLQNLILDFNTITSNKQPMLPKNCRLPRLTTLSLSANHISDLDRDFCSHFPHLENLNLRDNNRSMVDLRPLRKCANLKNVFWPSSVIKCTCDNLKDLKFNLVAPLQPSHHNIMAINRFSPLSEELICDPLESSACFPVGSEIRNNLYSTQLMFCDASVLKSKISLTFILSYGIMQCNLF